MPVVVDRGLADTVIGLSLLGARKKQETAKADSPYKQFQRTYRNNPAAFVHDCFRWNAGEGPTFYQYEILEELTVHKRISVRGPHGLGKTALESWIELWFALTSDGEDWKSPTTASAWRQLTHYLWPEIRKWARLLDWRKIGREPFDARSEMLSLSLKLGTGEAFAVASSEPALIEGAHADRLLYLFDESKAISAETFDATEGAFSGGGIDSKTEAYAAAMSTPGEPIGRFYEIQSRKPGYEDWWTRHVTLDDAINAGRISQEWADQRKRQWGENSAIYQNRVLGEFAASDEDGVVPLAWVELANERWREWDDAGRPLNKLTTVGVDVARSGADKTVFALRYNQTISELRRTSKEDTMQTTGRVAGILQAHGGQAVVDVIGIGAGVVDRLREQGLAVVAFNAAERTDARDRSSELGFTNMRSAGWWCLRELLDPANEQTVALPPDDLLAGDLTAPHWKVVSGGKVQIESKDEIRVRLGRSTDDGDAVVMAFADSLGGAIPFGWLRE